MNCSPSQLLLQAATKTTPTRQLRGAGRAQGLPRRQGATYEARTRSAKPQKGAGTPWIQQRRRQQIGLCLKGLTTCAQCFCIWKGQKLVAKFS